jgi:uncharacterized membrane protein
MREAMLIIHFIGLAMGIGTSFAFMFLGIKASSLEKEESVKFSLNTLVLSRMGQIGLTLLVLSGGYLMTPYWKVLGSMPLLIAKLVLVLVLGAVVGIASSKAKKAAAGNTEEELKKIRPLGMIGLATGLAIVVLAVLVFH